MKKKFGDDFGHGTVLYISKIGRYGYIQVIYGPIDLWYMQLLFLVYFPVMKSAGTAYVVTFFQGFMILPKYK